MHTRPRPGGSITAAAASFRPPRALGALVGAGGALWAIALSGAGAAIAASSDPGPAVFIAWCVAIVSAVVAVVFLYWVYALLSLRYVVDRDAITIRWGLHYVTVPLDTVVRLVPGRTIDSARVAGLNWWGCHIGTADVKRVGYTLFYSTHRASDEILYIVTRDECYALTVPNQAVFAEEVQDRAAIGPTRHVEHRSRATGIAAWPIWRDRLAVMTALLPIAPATALCGYLYWEYPGLPSVISFAFPALGSVVRVGDKSELLNIAYLALSVLAVNTVAGVLLHWRERAAGIWLFSAGGLIQSILLAAAVVAVQRA